MLLRDDYFAHFIKPPSIHPFYWWISIVSSLLFAIGCFFQTETFLTLFSAPSNDSLRKHILESRSMQDYIKRSAPGDTKRTPGVQTKFLANYLVERVDEQIKSLKNDPELQSQLTNALGVSFADVDVDILPSWEIERLSIKEVGLTPEGFQQTLKGPTDFLSGLTIRDKPGQPQVTLDGVPKIVLRPGAFASTRELRLTLFHELLHALNIPGYQPTKLNRACDDLVYFGLYRSYVNQSGLQPWDYYMWGVFSFIFTFSFLFISITYFRQRATE